MKLKTIAFFTYPKNHQYGVQQAFSEGLARALERAGVGSELFAYTDLGSGQILANLTKNRPSCTAGFNVVVGEHSPLEPLGLCHLSMIVDAASYFPELLKNPLAITSFVDEDSVGFFKMMGAKHVIYLPHAVEKAHVVSDNSMRDIDILLAASYIDIDEVVDILRALLSEKSSRELIQKAETVLSSETLSPLQAFVELVESHGSFEEELLQKKIPYFDLMNVFDRYIRAIDRVRIMEAIDRPLHIYGTGWKKNSKDIFHDPVPFEKMPELLRRSKIVINSVPMFKRGLHERLLLALASGASVVTNKSYGLQKVFGEGGGLDYFLAPHYKDVNLAIERALGDEDSRFKAVLERHDLILQEHTWDARAKELILQLPPHIEAIEKGMQGGISHLLG